MQLQVKGSANKKTKEIFEVRFPTLKPVIGSENWPAGPRANCRILSLVLKNYPGENLPDAPSILTTQLLLGEPLLIWRHLVKHLSIPF